MRDLKPVKTVYDTPASREGMRGRGARGDPLDRLNAGKPDRQDGIDGKDLESRSNFGD